MRPLLLALLTACTAELPAPPQHPYQAVRILPFTHERAAQACPLGYRVLWSETCPSVPGASEALVLCEEGK